jgi:hypothetical protein
MLRIIALASGALAFLLSTGASSASAQEIYGCVKDKNGALRIVRAPGDCSSRETPISWNQVGPQGEPGMDGADGQPGEPGTEGPPGPSLRVFDLNGVEIGILVNGDAGQQKIFRESSGTTFSVSNEGDLLLASDLRLIYEEPDCGGTPYVVVPGPIGGFLYGSGEGPVALENGAPSSIRSLRSERDTGGACLIVSRENLVVPVRAVDLGLSFPLPAPLYVGLQPAPEPAP